MRGKFQNFDINSIQDYPVIVTPNRGQVNCSQFKSNQFNNDKSYVCATFCKFSKSWL